MQANLIDNILQKKTKQAKDFVSLKIFSMCEMYSNRDV